MRIKLLATNQTLLTLSSGVDVFFSYETPVAGRDGTGFFRTKNVYSKTTTKHINGYVGGICRKVEQAWIESLCRGES